MANTPEVLIKTNERMMALADFMAEDGNYL